MTYANVVATLALVVAMGGTAAAAGVLITSNSQVRHDTISGHQPPSGKHANIITGSINATDLSTGVKDFLTVHCPSGLVQAGNGLCFDPTPRAAADFYTALQRCRAALLRLPTVGELAEVYEYTDAVQATQWTSGWTFEASVPDVPARPELVTPDHVQHCVGDRIAGVSLRSHANGLTRWGWSSFTPRSRDSRRRRE